MRILLIHNRYQQRGGEDVVFESEGELLEKHGHEVERMIFDNNQIAGWKSKLQFAAQFLYNWRSKKIVTEKIESFHPDIIHVHNFVAAASPSVFYAANKFHIPVIHTLHNFRLICPSATLFYGNAIYEKSLHTIFPVDAIIKGVYRDSRWQTAALAMMIFLHRLLGTWRKRITRYIALTDFAARKFAESRIDIPRSKFVLKPNFVFDCGTGTNPREDFYLFVGRLSPQKGIDMLLRAATLKTFNLTIIGDGPLSSQVSEASDVLHNIRYLGAQDKKTVISYMKKCRALLFCSISYESFALTIVEAFSTGTPVIAAKLGGIGEIVVDGFNGFHFAPGNERDLCRAIDELTSRPDLTQTFSENARLTYEQRFTPEVNYPQLYKIYTDAISELDVAHVLAPEAYNVHPT